MRAIILGILGCLVSFCSPASSAAAGTPAPVCGAGQWVLAGSVAQALVLDVNGRVALTGACPAIAAKVKGTKKGTSVKAAWPSGFCGGVNGKGKIAAIIDPSCQTMHGKFSAKKLSRIFDATRSPCAVGLVDTGGTPRCVTPVVDTGTAELHTTLDANGCLVADVVLTTETGISAHLQAGSCLRTLGKKSLKGDVEIALDDAGGPSGTAGVVGIVRLRVRPKGAGALIVVAVEPPAALTLPLGDFALAGTWFTNAFLDAGGFTTTLHAATPVLLDAVPIVDGGAEQVQLAIAGPLGFSFEPSTAAETARSRPRPRAAGPTTVSLAIPTDPNLPDPRVETWQVINPKTAQIVMAGFEPDGFGVGESVSRIRQGRTFTVALLEAAGQRRVEITTDFSNRFHVELGFFDATNENTSLVGGDAVGGCAEDTCLTDAYVGFVKVTARAKNLAEIVSVRDIIAARLPAGARVAIHRIATVGSAKEAIMSIYGLDGSTRAFAPGLPTSWAVATGDRTLAIDTHPANIFGEWRGTFEIPFESGPPFGCPVNDPLCARLTVQSAPNGLRIAYCNGRETFCSASAATQQCALLFDGNAAPGGFSAIGVNNNAPCCIGCLGQDRAYGCRLDATVTTDGRGQQTLVGTFPGSVTFCPSAPGTAGVTHIKMCRPKPCAVP